MEESQGINGVDDSYRHLPILYLTFLTIWSFSACSWTVNTFKNRHFQVNKSPIFSLSYFDKFWIFHSWVYETSSQIPNITQNLINFFCRMVLGIYCFNHEFRRFCF